MNMETRKVQNTGKTILLSLLIIVLNPINDTYLTN